jgi:hypothetical protein
MSDSPRSLRLSSDHVVSGAAIFVSLCTLVVLLYEARIMREQQRAAVWPYVEVGMGFSDDGFHVRTYNQGIGPARIQSMEVRVDGEPVQTWTEMFDSLGVETSGYSQDRTNGRVIPGQTQLASLQATGDSISAPVYDAYLNEGRLTFALCYCSVYDDCWQLETRALDEERERVDDCTPDPATEFDL